MNTLENQKKALEWFKSHFVTCDDCIKCFDFTCSGADSERCNAYEQAIVALTVIQEMLEKRGENETGNMDKSD